MLLQYGALCKVPAAHAASTASITASTLLQDRAASAASGVIVYLDFKAEKLWGGQVGHSRQLIIGQLFHGLAAQRTNALVLDTPSGYDTCWHCLLYCNLGHVCMMVCIAA